MPRVNLTKEVVNKFIADSARACGLSVASYLENKANRSYVVLIGSRPLTFDEDSTDICVFDSKALALEEAAEYENAKVITEYDYYLAKGIFSNAA